MRKKLLLAPLLLVLIINSFFYLIDLRIDLTNDKKHSISVETKQILSQLDDIVFLKIYLDGDFPAEFKHLQSELINLLNSFKAITNNNFEFEFINPNQSKDEKEKVALFKQLVKNGLSPTDIEVRSSSAKSSQIIFPGALIYYKDRQQAVNFLKNSVTKKPGENINVSIENLEFEFISAIHNLTKTKINKIAFLDGNGELTYDDVYDLTESVLQDNDRLSYYYDVDRFNIKAFEIDSSTMEVNISKQIKKISNYKALIIAKPTIPFNSLDKYIIDQYIMNGGKVLWLIDGVNANMDSLQKKNSIIAQKKN